MDTASDVHHSESSSECYHCLSFLNYNQAGQPLCFILLILITAKGTSDRRRKTSKMRFTQFYDGQKACANTSIYPSL